MHSLVLMVKDFNENFNEIAKQAISRKMPDKQIEKMQEIYVKSYITTLFLSSNIPKEIRLRLIDEIKEAVVNAKT